MTKQELFDISISETNNDIYRKTKEMWDTSGLSGTSGKVGLDLNVIDHYDGSERSVKTLSGGESFMAALSLALGMADEVQKSSGGI